MFRAAFWSRSISRPHSEHLNILVVRGMWPPTCPQREHVRVVYAGFTFSTRTSDFLALCSSFCVRDPNAASV